MLDSAAAMSLVNREPRDVNESYQYRRTDGRVSPSAHYRKLVRRGTGISSKEKN